MDLLSCRHCHHVLRGHTQKVDSAAVTGFIAATRPFPGCELKKRQVRRSQEYGPMTVDLVLSENHQLESHLPRVAERW